MSSFTVFDNSPQDLVESDDESNLLIASNIYVHNTDMNITSRLIEIEEEDEVEVFHGQIFSTINTLTTEESIIEEANGINSEANIAEQSYDENTDDNNQTRTSNIEEAADSNEQNSEDHFTSNDAEENNAIVDDQA